MKKIKWLLYDFCWRIYRSVKYPFRNFGVSFEQWSERQKNLELDFWKFPEKYESKGKYASTREKLIDINIHMFKFLKRNFGNAVVCEIGCGPYAGILPKIKASVRIGIDPLAKEYRNIFKPRNILMMDSMAENLPFPNETVDALFCINALDHMQKPAIALLEMVRVLKKNGYFALSVDVGGTPHHQNIIYKSDLDQFLINYFLVREKRCSTSIRTTWDLKAKIPVYVFQGFKK